MVVLSHYWALAGIKPGVFVFLFTGVDLFFVISGFVFAPYFFGKALSPQPFFVKRFFRIYPLFAISLLVYAALKVANSQEAKYLVTHLLFLYTTDSREVAFYYNPAYWSLPTEVEFYLLLPAMAYVARFKRGFVTTFVVALTLHFVIAYLIPLDMQTLNNYLALSVHLPGLLIEFLLGVIAWKIAQSHLSSTARFLMLVAGAAAWFVAAYVFDFYFARGGDNGVLKSDLLRGNVGLLAALAFAPIVAALAYLPLPPALWFKKMCLWLGNLSFGIYLFHNAAPQILNLFGVTAPPLLFASLCLGLTFLIAQILYSYLENPCRNYGRALAQKFTTKKIDIKQTAQPSPPSP